jgi:hypothetical protein
MNESYEILRAFAQMARMNKLKAGSRAAYKAQFYFLQGWIAAGKSLPSFASLAHWSGRCFIQEFSKIKD